MYLFIGQNKRTVLRMKGLFMELRAEGASTHVTSTETAKQVIMDYSPSLIFLDLDNDKYSGIDALQELKECRASGHVVCTSQNNSLMLEAFRNGAFDFLLKPTQSQELSAVLQRHYQVKLSTQQKEYSPLIARLTRRQQEILELIVQGKSSRQIGESLFLSRHTVDTHRRNILRTVNCRSTIEVMGLFA